MQIVENSLDADVVLLNSDTESREWAAKAFEDIEKNKRPAVVTVKWILDSLSAFQLVDKEKYGVSPPSPSRAPESPSV